MESPGTPLPNVNVPQQKQSLSHIISRLKFSQRPPELDAHTPENVQRSEVYEKKAEGLFGNSKDLLVKFGLAEKDAQTIADTLSSGEWMFTRDFLLNTGEIKKDAKNEVKIEFHSPHATSKERQLSGKEPFDAKEVPTAELQFNLSDMIQSAVESAHLNPELTEKIMAGYSGLTRYKDFGLSLQFSVEEDEGQISGKAMRFSNLKSKIADQFQNADANSLIIGGWTSNIDFSHRQNDPQNGPQNEADLSQQYLSRKKIQGKQAFVVSCAGPGMERNVFSDQVTYDEPFGPHDHMLGVAAAYTLLGKGNADRPMDLALEGHSMGGAGMIAVLEHYKFPPQHNVAITALHPAIAGTNAWANLTEQISKAGDPLVRTVGRKGLATVVSGAIDVMDISAKRMHAQRVYTPLKEAISSIATSELFLPGDTRNMPQLVKKHVDMFKTYTASSTLSALGSITDLPLDGDRLNAMMKDEKNATKFVLVTDKDDQMVETESMLRQLPYDVPLFVLDDKDEGSHYSFKRNCRSLRLSLLQQTMEQFTKPQFSYAYQDLFLKAYSDKLYNPEQIGALLQREGATFATQFGISSEELSSYLQKRAETKILFAGRKPNRQRNAFFDALAGADPTRTKELLEYYQLVSGQPDLGLKYFYSSNPEKLSTAIMPESRNSKDLAKLELLLETLETLSDQVHFNVESDPLLKRTDIKLKN
ncbi:MAG: hypothetical protein NTV98_02835 [Candidatus Roizmanbacteria bacterium]|nr:hypothetical protein [Candidatus Roizmanbacteria bacterium]